MPEHSLREQAGRVPPQAVEIERAILGAMLIEREAVSKAIGTIDAGRFYDPRHEKTFAAIEKLFSEGAAVDLLSLSEELRRRGELDAIGGYYLTELTADVASAANVEYHCRIVAEKALLRDVIASATAIVGQAYDPASDAFDVLDALQARVLDISVGASDVGRSGDAHVRHAVAEALARTEDWRQGQATDFRPSGFYSLDTQNGGLPLSEVTMLASQSGMGKTSLLCASVGAVARGQLARATHGVGPAQPIVIFSAEMSREQIVHRLASQQTGLNLRRLRSGSASENEYERYDAALADLAALPLYVDDEPAPTFAHIAARLEQVRQASPDGTLALVAVDYDEKVDARGAELRSEELRVSAIARGLKTAAKRFRAPFLVLSQYARKERMYAYPPGDEWLRYSGKKQHEAAMIVHWIWPRYWVDKGVKGDSVWGYDPNRPERGYLIVTKARFGPLGKVAMDFTPETTSFRDPQEPGQRYTAAELALRPQGTREATQPTQGQQDAQDRDDRADFDPDGESPF